nr:unnamed protein product [Digitaria exilis]
MTQWLPRTAATVAVYALVALIVAGAAAAGGGEQPLSRIAIHRATIAPQPGAFVDASPALLGLQGNDREWVTVTYSNPKPSKDDWIGVFSPANFKYKLIHISEICFGRLTYTYQIGHRLFNGSVVRGHQYSFKAPPYPGEDSLQRVVIFGDMGKAEADGSNEFNDFEPGSLNTTNQLIKDLKNIDMVFHIGDITYANGYLSQWDQFTAQVEPIASTVPYMVGSGNHERDWPGSGSFYRNLDSGGECGVPSQNMFYVPAENREQFWYSMDYGMFRFCIANTELDWRPGTEQYRFIEHCLSSVDRQKQPWLIFLAHRVLGYSSATFYADEGTTEEPMGRESLQSLWQKYKVDIAMYGHVHGYERTCPVYEVTCAWPRARTATPARSRRRRTSWSGGGGASLADYTTARARWSHAQDRDFGFAKLTAFNHTTLLFEYIKSRDGSVHDHFTVSRDYRDVLACGIDNCPSTTLAS